MPGNVATSPEFSWRRRVFSLIVLGYLVTVAFIGVVLLQPHLIAGLLGHEMAGHISRHFRDPHHRVHDLTFSFLFGTSVVGILAQLRRPSENVAGQLMAVIPWIALVLIAVLSNTPPRFAPLPILVALTLLATILHPTGRDLFSSFRVSRVNRLMLPLIIAAAAPLLAFASANIGLQRTVTNDHAALGHYGFLAAFGVTVIGVGRPFRPRTHTRPVTPAASSRAVWRPAPWSNFARCSGVRISRMRSRRACRSFRSSSRHRACRSTRGLNRSRYSTTSPAHRP